MAGRGKVYVVSAPSGGGKGTILSRVLDKDPHMRYSVSVTTRRPRKGEIDGKDYLFVDDKRFQRWIDEERFAEWAVVHDERYGTLRMVLDEQVASGCDVLLELDVQGMRSILSQRDDIVSIFITPPSLEILEQRLRKRGGLREAQIRVRLENARGELAVRGEYDHTVVNDDLEEAIRRFEAIVCENR